MIKRLPLRKLYLRTVWHFQRKSFFCGLCRCQVIFFLFPADGILFAAAYAAVKLFFLFPADGVPFAAAYAAISVFACFLPFPGGPFAVANAAISVFACFLPFPGGPSAAIFFRAAP